MMKRSEQYTFSPDLSRLFAAAVVSPDFCQTLLHDAAAALATGYMGHSFALSAAEESLVLSIEANTLADFADQVVTGKTIQGDTVSAARPAAPAAGHSYDNGAMLGAFPGL
jgi:hypothetical protein